MRQFSTPTKWQEDEQKEISSVNKATKEKVRRQLQENDVKGKSTSSSTSITDIASTSGQQRHSNEQSGSDDPQPSTSGYRPNDPQPSTSGYRRGPVEPPVSKDNSQPSTSRERHRSKERRNSHERRSMEKKVERKRSTVQATSDPRPSSSSIQRHFGSSSVTKSSTEGSENRATAGQKRKNIDVPPTERSTEKKQDENSKKSKQSFKRLDKITNTFLKFKNEYKSLTSYFLERVCVLCLTYVPGKVSDHLQSDRCPFLNLNFQKSKINRDHTITLILTCEHCQLIFKGETRSLRFLMHLEILHPNEDVFCLHCESRIPLSELGTHNHDIHLLGCIDIAKPVCKAHNRIFANCQDFLCHVQEVHSRCSKPNAGHISRTLYCPNPSNKIVQFLSLLILNNFNKIA